jgi:hypothetical protein
VLVRREAEQASIGRSASRSGEPGPSRDPWTSRTVATDFPREMWRWAATPGVSNYVEIGR